MQDGVIIWSGKFKYDGVEIPAAIAVNPSMLASLFAADKRAMAAAERALISGEEETASKMGNSLILKLHRPREE
jgi:hypothetical protein